ncbi:hypothetical protein GINT2_002196 [Glugoides intestinalis]
MAEDISTWTTNAKFLFKLYELDEKTAKRVLSSSLRGIAFEWARETLTKEPETTVQKLLEGLNSRFLSRMRITETAQRFLSDKIPEQNEKFFAMMRDASYLFEQGYMSLQAVADRMISRSPPEIRIALWNIAGVAQNMFDFSKAAEQVIPLAYGKEVSMSNQAQVNFVKKKNFPGSSKSQKKWCEVHGEKGHTTQECLTIRKLKEKGWRQQRPTANTVKTEKKDEESKEDSNYYYYFSAQDAGNKFTNPFLITGKLNQKKAKILLDTGADLTLLPAAALPKSTVIHKTKDTAKAANGSQIPILGKVRNVQLEILGLNIRIKSALVTSESLEYTLLGAPTIKENFGNLVKAYVEKNSITQ